MKLSELIEKYGDCEVSDELLAMIETKGEWEPKLNERYYFITGVGSVSNNNYKNTDQDNFRIEKRNCYKSEGEAQFALDMYNFCKERSFEPDWEVENSKWFVRLNYYVNEAYVADCVFDECGCPFYYESKEVAQEVIDKYSFEELAKYYGRV